MQNQSLKDVYQHVNQDILQSTQQTNALKLAHQDYLLIKQLVIVNQLVHHQL